jgi:ferric-dicitrate binding protein FerR (iron transport regulator)
MQYDAARFSTDHYFLDWRILDDPAAGAFWEGFLERHPGKRAEIDAAIRVVDSARFNQQALSPEETRREVERLHFSARRLRRGRVAWRFTVAASVLVALLAAFLARRGPGEKELEELVARARENKIQLVLSDTRVVELERNAEITYDTSGTITVDGEEGERLVTPRGEGSGNRLVVPAGRHASLVLPDGSKAWVNARTTLEFPARFDGSSREIRVSGEIYIEVARDTLRPFLLHAPRFSVSVTGTRFNVTAYPEEREQSVVLVEGTVLVALPGGEAVAMRPSERFTADGDVTRVERVDPLDYISWKDGVLRFSGRPLPRVLASLSRYYGVPIGHEEMDDVRLTGKLVLFDDLATVLENITVIAPLRYAVGEDGVTVTNDKK